MDSEEFCMPLVSVIMTSYNYGSYISKAIASVLDQTFADFELIVLDDGSVDGSRDIIRRYADADSRVKYVFHEANAGIASTNNEGIETASGKFIAFINSDDLWARDKLEKQLAILEKDEDVVVWTEGAIINKDGRPLRKNASDDIWRGSKLEKQVGIFERSEDLIVWSELEILEADQPGGQKFTEFFGVTGKRKSGDIFGELLYGNFILCSGLLFKKDILGDIRFNPGLKYLNDFLFYLDLAKKYRFHFIGEPLIKYRVHGKNWTLRDNLGWNMDNIKFNELVIGRYGRAIPRRLKSRLLCVNGMIYSRMGHSRMALGYLFRGIMLYPVHVYYLLILCYLTAKNAYRRDNRGDTSAAIT
jgi:glycosyltransferase involved in cell wall biosynthesis